MIANLIRKALGPEIENRLNGESIRLNAIINELENALDDVKSIRASDIADNISTYDIAADISIDTYELARNIEIDATDIEIDYAALARHLGDNIEIDVSDIEVDTRDLAERIAGEIGNNIEIKYSDLARDISVNIDTTGIADAVVSQIETTLEIQHQNMITVNMNNRLNEIEKKMNILLEHFGITPENV